MTNTQIGYLLWTLVIIMVPVGLTLWLLVWIIRQQIFLIDFTPHDLLVPQDKPRAATGQRLFLVCKDECRAQSFRIRLGKGIDFVELAQLIDKEKDWRQLIDHILTDIPEQQVIFVDHFE